MAAQDQDGRLGFADPVLVNSAASRLRPSGFAPLAQDGIAGPVVADTRRNQFAVEYMGAAPCAYAMARAAGKPSEECSAISHRALDAEHNDAAWFGALDGMTATATGRKVLAFVGQFSAMAENC